MTRKEIKEKLQELNISYDNKSNTNRLFKLLQKSQENNVGYKVFDPNWKCRNFQYEIGKSYIHTGNIGLCKEGFHFCKKLSDCFSYYQFASNNKVALIRFSGNTIHGNDKSVTDRIEIIREISWHEVLDLVNLGKNNSGFNNTGNDNSGHFNSGNDNSGDFNSGYRNSGYKNSGNDNSGNFNSGNFNSGHFNSGNYNSSENGYQNYFCTESKYFLFDIEVSRETINKLSKIYSYDWFDLKNKSYYDAWKECPEKTLKYLKSLPEFQTLEAIEKFKIITNIDLNNI